MSLRVVAHGIPVAAVGQRIVVQIDDDARVDIATTDQRRYQVVVDTMDDAEQIVAALTHVA